jgi:isopentenyl-diphosphate delta-isomerase
MQTEKRKSEHVNIVLSKNVQYERGAGFEHVEFVHCALPEIDFDDVDLSCDFLGKRLDYPLLIEAMTGGYKEAAKINKELATAAEKHRIAFGVGSQRAMLENPELKSTYFVRDVAPTIALLGNIGAAQLKKYPVESIESLVSSIEADGLAIHLNTLQEVLQPEGDKDFSGVLRVIEQVCERLDVPVIVKETGAGISTEIALMLREVGVRYIDVGGAGGTSWAKVEYRRGKNVVKGFEEWGIRTVDSILMCRGILPLIASGGIRSGIDAAKVIALGAEIAGAAYPFLVAMKNKRLDALINEWKEQMKIVTFLTGSKNYAGLRKAKLIIRNANFL